MDFINTPLLGLRSPADLGCCFGICGSRSPALGPLHRGLHADHCCLHPRSFSSFSCSFFPMLLSVGVATSITRAVCLYLEVQRDLSSAVLSQKETSLFVVWLLSFYSTVGLPGFRWLCAFTWAIWAKLGLLKALYMKATSLERNFFSVLQKPFLLTSLYMLHKERRCYHMACI